MANPLCVLFRFAVGKSLLCPIQIRRWRISFCVYIFSFYLVPSLCENVRHNSHLPCAFHVHRLLSVSLFSTSYSFVFNKKTTSLLEAVFKRIPVIISFLSLQLIIQIYILPRRLSVLQGNR